jgi:3-deoxy-D-manno-octulosonic-acid transferase
MAARVGGALAVMKTALARAVYAALMRLLMPLLPLRLWWRARREPLYRQAIGERFGLYATLPSSGWVWLHAVSLGETRAAKPLVDELRERLPGMRLLLTHGTATGREAGAALLREGDVQCWLPWDTPRAARRFLAHHRPRIGVVMETEVWPALLDAARSQGVPMVLANARLSDKSLQQSLRLDALMRPAAGSFAAVLAQTDDDARRLRTAGARDVQVLGNLKFDMNPAPALLARGSAWRAATGRPVVLAASTREGEEEPLLRAWRALAAPRPLLLVVPRHPQRFDEVAQLVQAAGFSLARRSAWSEQPDANTGQADVWLGDTMGEMPAYYACAHVALLGGSFAPLGGQNLIEAAACGCPVLMGPSTFNFAEAAALALAAGAAARVRDLDEAVQRAAALATGLEREAWSQRASAFAQAHQGAARRMADVIAQAAAQQA